MENIIFKYTLQITDEQVINIPKEAEILTVQMQYEELQLWALIDPKEEDNEEMYIEVFGTGNAINSGFGIKRKYISTCQSPTMGLVWHIFERLN